MNMMDLRRKMLLAGADFPSNYLFKEGLGLRKDLEYFFGLQSSDKCYVDNNSIYMEGLANGYDPGITEDTHSSLYIGAGLVFENGYLHGNVIDTKGYSTLNIDAYINDNTTREAFFALLNIDRLSENVFKETQNMKDNPYWQRNNNVYSAWFSGHTATGKTSTDGRYTITFDISDMESIILNLFSPDWNATTNGKRIEIFNIWFE